MLPVVDNTVDFAGTWDRVRVATGDGDRPSVSGPSASGPSASGPSASGPSVSKRWLFAFGLAVVAVFAGTLSCDRASAEETSEDSRSASDESAGDKPQEIAGDSRGEAGTLSVAPSDHVEYPEDRPEWIDAENDLRSPVHRWIVRTPPCETREECEDSLAFMFLSELHQYGSALTGSPFADDVSIEEDELLESLVARRYDGTLTQGNLAAYESALELRIGPDFQGRVWRQVRNGEVRQRIGAVGVMSAGGLALVVMLAGATAGISRHRASRSSAA